MSRTDAASTLALAGVVERLLADQDIDAATAELARYLRSLFGVDGVAVLRMGRAEMHLAGVTGIGVGGVVEAELSGVDGPALDAVDGEPLIVTVEDDPRWPSWRARARRAGFGRVTAARLRPPGGQTIGAIELFERQLAGPEPDARLVAAIAAHLAAVLAIRLRCEQLQQAVAGRHRIGMAQGILIERHGLDARSSFEALKRVSQERNIKLLAVADVLVAAPRSAH